MKFRDLVFLTLGASAGMLIYGSLVEANRLVLEERRLKLKGWPKKLSGYKIAVLADLHLRDRYSMRLAKRAVQMALAAEPDAIVLPGDLVAYWKEESVGMLLEVLEPLRAFDGPVFASLGNHEYWQCDPIPLPFVCDRLGITLLRNEAVKEGDIIWAGVDSANAKMADEKATMKAAKALGRHPILVLWHEPDVVDRLPHGAVLMISGHSHGGQFRFPGGYTPIHTTNGRKYPRGYYPEAPTPLYVSRGVGTTGPPSRFNCPPEVSLLILEPAE